MGAAARAWLAKISMTEIRALIAAAGAGTRVGLPYPKTLHPVLGRPILLRLIERLRTVDGHPTVIVSPTGHALIAECLADARVSADLVEQAEPTGMGDAILAFRQAPAFDRANHVLLVWGDIPMLGQATIDAVVKAHLASGNDLTLASRVVDNAYTRVQRDAAGKVVAIVETREAGLTLEPGERDIGLFVFRVKPVFDLLEQRRDGAIGMGTGEHGFLYIIRHLVEAGRRVEALAIASEDDLVSLNRLSDLIGINGPAR